MITAILFACLLVPCVQHKPTPEEAFGKPGGDDAQVEALIQRVQEQLAAVDEALHTAADEDRATAQLNAARQAHLSVIRDIEELIKQFKYTESQSQSSSGGGGGKSDPSQSQGAPQPKPEERESDGQQHADPKSGAQPPKAESQSAEEKSGQPQGGEPNSQPASQQPGDQLPPPPDAGRFERQDTDARWGLLPPKVQERLMNLHVDDLPERYRTWMDAYIRQLNRLEQGGGRP